MIIIETGRLRLVPFSAEYITQVYVNWLNDPLVVCYSEQRHCVHNLESCRDYLASFTGSGNYLWAIEESKEGRHIGNMNGYVDAPNLVADVGILIGVRDAWNVGYATEAYRAVISFLFAQGLRKITVGCLSLNIGMLSVMKKLGLKEDGMRRRHALVDGSEADLVHRAVFREDWING